MSNFSFGRSNLKLSINFTPLLILECFNKSDNVDKNP